MRVAGIGLVLIFMLLLTGCASPARYTSQDLSQVKSTFHELLPVYDAFKVAWRHNNLTAMTRQFKREQVVCRQVDVIDARDSITPDTDLFWASTVLDNMCNDIESVYSSWRMAHGYSYDKTTFPTNPGQEFADGDYGVTQMAKLTRHPGAYA
jgi:hypothetical protein